MEAVMSPFLKRALTVIIFAIFAFAVPSDPQAAMAFDKQAFKMAQMEGKPILLDVTAPWCSVCRKQEPIIKSLEGSPKFSGLKVFSIDFDSSKDLLKELGVKSQSTLIVYKGEKEVGRSTGSTDAKEIEALLMKAF
jgi:thioredoxin 1